MFNRDKASLIVAGHDAWKTTEKKYFILLDECHNFITGATQQMHIPKALYGMQQNNLLD